MTTFTINVSPIRLSVSPQLPDDVFALIRKETRYRVYGCEFTPLFKSHVWDGYKFLFYKNQTAPSGCYQRIKRAIETSGHTADVVFERNLSVIDECKLVGIDLFEFQNDAINAAIKNRYCVLSAPIRSGKTAIIAGILKRVQHYPAWVLTKDRDIVRQTRKEISKFLDRSVGVFSESEFEKDDIIVSSYQALARIFSEVGARRNVTISRNEEIFESIKDTKVLILDECQYACSKRSRFFMEKFENVGYKVSLSGTPKRDTMSTREVEGMLGPVVFKVKYSKLIEIGRLAKPFIYMYDLPVPWYQYGFSEYREYYDSNIVQNVYRNSFINRLVKELNKKGKTVYIMVSRKYHGELLNRMIDGSVYVYGAIDSDIRAELYNNLQNKKLWCIIATVGKHGLNLPRLDVVINAEGLSSSVLTTQKMRSLTACEGKSQGIVIDFIDKGNHLQDHSATRLKHYTKLDGFSVTIKKVPIDFTVVEETNDQEGQTNS